jgi:hypothetical protein
MDGKDNYEEWTDGEEIINRWKNVDLLGALDVMRYGVEYKEYKNKDMDKNLTDEQKRWINGLRKQYEMGVKMGHIMKFSHKREEMIEELKKHIESYIFQRV